MKVFAETPRLILRELLVTDVDGIFELESDSEVHRYVGNQPISTIEEARDTIDFIRKQYIENGIGRWAVIEKASGDFIGWSGLKLIRESVNDHIDHIDVGYRLIRKYWGKGFATESAVASVDYGFGTMKLDEIFATVHVENIASRRVLEKAGLKVVEPFDYNGEPYYWMEILKRE